jgi:hypothetical protein
LVPDGLQKALVEAGVIGELGAERDGEDQQAGRGRDQAEQP